MYILVSSNSSLLRFASWRSSQFSTIMIVITIYTSALSIYPFLETMCTVKYFMKNQYPQCIHKQTMKMQTRIIFAACFVIMIFNNFGTGVEVSSNIDLDSNENEETLGNPILDIITNSEKSASPPESILHAPKPSTFVWRHGSEFVKANEQRKRRIYPSHVSNRKKKKKNNDILQVTS